MSASEAVEVPPSLAGSYARGFGEEGRAWIAGLPGLAAEFLDRWELRRDGAAAAGEASLVLPVLCANGTRAVLRLQMPREETTAALIGLRTWDGDGMVRLLDHDPGSGTMLLERLDASRTLASVEDDDVAMGVLAGLQARLVRVPAPPGLRGLGDIAAGMLERAPRAAAALADPADRRILRGWASAVAELVGEPGDRMLHWDLHYDNVLAAQREPWLAIDPEPLAGSARAVTAFGTRSSISEARAPRVRSPGGAGTRTSRACSAARTPIAASSSSIEDSVREASSRSRSMVPPRGSCPSSRTVPAPFHVRRPVRAAAVSSRGICSFRTARVPSCRTTAAPARLPRLRPGRPVPAPSGPGTPRREPAARRSRPGPRRRSSWRTTAPGRGTSSVRHVLTARALPRRSRSRRKLPADHGRSCRRPSRS